MTNESPKDIFGNDIELGDLVVSSTVTSYSNMKVGIVSHIGPREHGDHTITIQYTYERNKYAYELGAPKLEEKYRAWGQYKDEATGRMTYGYYGEEKTRMVNDRRVVGKTTDLAKQARQKSCNILIIRKKDGKVPAQLMAAVENHIMLYPDSEGVQVGSHE